MIRTILNSVTTTETGSELIDLDDVKRYLGISTDIHDELLVFLLKSSREEVEKYTKKALVSKTVIAYYDSVNEYLKLPITPVTSVTSVVDADDIEVSYTLGKGDNPRVNLTSSSEVIITYESGYEELPNDLQLCVIKAVCEDFEFRTGIKANNVGLLPNNWRNTALKYRDSWLM